MNIISNENQSLQKLNEKAGRKLKFSLNEEGNIIYLSLYSTNFPILPNELKNFPFLEELNLGNMNLEKLPEWIGDFKYLKNLSLDDNNLETIPESIGNLLNLEILDISHNNIIELPSSIGNLVNLTDFSLFYNKLSDLPESITSLEKIENFGCNDNPFQYPPLEVCDEGFNNIRLYFYDIRNKFVKFKELMKKSLKIEKSALKKSLNFTKIELNHWLTSWQGVLSFDIHSDEVESIKNSSLKNQDEGESKENGMNEENSIKNGMSKDDIIDSLIGSQLDKWKIIKKLGKGGQAATLIAIAAGDSNKTEYVMKFFLPRKDLNQDIMRFKKEIKALNKANGHENIVIIVDYHLGKSGKDLYYVMEKCDKDLEQLIQNRSRSDYLLEIFDFYSEILTGVKFLHSIDIIHRDLKPANILLKDNKIKVGDFGICFIPGTERDTFTMEQVGPKYYIAPELLRKRADNITFQADYYSLGKVLYYLLSDGVHLYGEYFNKPKFSLSRLLINPKYDLFNEFFSKTINFDIEGRYESIDELIEGFQICKSQFISNNNSHTPMKKPSKTYNTYDSKQIHRNKERILSDFYYSLKNKKWIQSVKYVNNPRYEQFLREYFSKSYKPHSTSKIATLKSVNFLFKLAEDPAIHEVETRIEIRFSNDQKAFNELFDKMLLDFIESYPYTVIDPIFELIRFQEKMESNKIFEILKEYEILAKVFKDKNIFILHNFSNSKIRIQLKSLANHSLTITRNVNECIVQFTSHINKMRKNESIGCSRKYNKEGEFEFVGQNGHNKPQIFPELMKNFFEQAKEDIT